MYIQDDFNQGPGNDFYLGGALVIRKMKFSQFWKFLLYKTSILGGAQAPPAPPVPRCLDMMMKAEEIGSYKHSTRLLLFFDGTYVCTQIISRARHVSRVPNGWTHYVPHKTPCVYNVTVVRFLPFLIRSSFNNIFYIVYRYFIIWTKVQNMWNWQNRSTFFGG